MCTDHLLFFGWSRRRMTWRHRRIHGNVKKCDVMATSCIHTRSNGEPEFRHRACIMATIATDRKWLSREGDFPLFHLFWDGGPWFSVLDHEMALFFIVSVLTNVRHLGWSRRACVNQELSWDDFRSFWWFPALFFSCIWSLMIGVCSPDGAPYQICVRDGPTSWMVATRMRQSGDQGRRFPVILMISRAFFLYLILDDRCLFARWGSVSNLRSWWSTVLDGRDAYASVLEIRGDDFRSFWWFPALFSCIWSSMIGVCSRDGAPYQICVRDGPPSWMVATRMRQSGDQGRRFPVILMIPRAFFLYLVLDDRCLFVRWGSLSNLRSWWSAVLDGGNAHKSIWRSRETISGHSDDFPRFFLEFGPRWSVFVREMGLCIKSAFVMVRRLGWSRRACVSLEIKGDDFRSFWWFSPLFSCIWFSMIGVCSRDGAPYQSAFVMVRRLRWSRRACVSQEPQGRRFPAVFLVFCLYFGSFDLAKGIPSCQGWLASTILDDRHAHASVKLLLRRKDGCCWGEKSLFSNGSEGSEGYREGVSFLVRIGRVPYPFSKGRKGTGRVYPFSEGYREDTVSFLGRVGRVPGGCILSRKGRKGIVSFLGRVQGGCILSRKGRKGTGRVHPFSGGSEGYREGTVSFLGRVGRVPGGCILSRKGRKGTVYFLGRVPGGCILSRKGLKTAVSFLGRVPGGYRILYGKSRKGTLCVSAAAAERERCIAQFDVGSSSSCLVVAHMNKCSDQGN